MWGLHAALWSLFGLTRKCPKCGQKQVVQLDEKFRVTKCTYCGASVPPPNEVEGRRR